ncbi:MAG: preprotein translocase subunit SecE [Candidatus Thioglobus sp.]|nr:preprotein translocase subunit SecE [Gammaproteobacteria bacterium]MDP6164297.1 preprotein translocase subunit SecE [Candidatus Thioglobus sp.]
MGVQVPPGLPVTGVIVIESNKEINQGSEILKLMASLAILLGSIYVFYMYSDLSVLIRALLIIFSAVVATLIFFTTHRGSIFWSFLQGSRVEMRKVVWPTKEETLQTALTVFIFVLILGIFFWLLDFLLLFVTTFIRG